MKRIVNCTAVLAALLIAAQSFASCSNTTVENEQDASTPSEVSGGMTEETAPETEDPWYGLEKVDLEGMEFHILTCNWPGEAVWTVDDFTAEEFTGSPINDAVYDRNIRVEDRLNCQSVEVNINAKEDAYNALKISVAAADNAYQLWVPRMQQYISAAAGGYIMDMKTVEGIDFSNPSWVQNSLRGLSLLNHNFAVCNEMMTIHKEAVSSIIFNKNLAAQYQLEDLYTVVQEERWTLDAFSSLVQETSRDLDGDGEMTPKDQWGFLYQRDTMDAFLAGGGGAICSKDEEDRPLYIFDTEPVIDILMRSTDLLYNKNVCYNVMNATGDFNEWMTKKFMSDEAMFMWVRNVNIPQLRTMESDFGILPNPKFNEDMETYCSVVNSYTGAALTIPTIVDPNVEKYVGLFAETMGAASMSTLSVAYYDTLLNGIVVRDEESQNMLDIIYANTSYDPGSIGAYANINDYIYMTMNYVNTFASYNAKMKHSVEKAIDKTCEEILEKYPEN